MNHSLSPEELEKSTTLFDRTFGKMYDLHIHSAGNILPGRAIYTANHFHHFDPIFILYAIARFGKVLAHQMTKPSLYKIPFFKKALKKYKTIVTPRPSQGEDFDFDDYERMKLEVQESLDKDEPISYAYAARMTKNYKIDKQSIEKEKQIATSGLLSIVRKQRGLKIVPVAVETYQKRSRKMIAKAIFTLTGLRSLFPRGKKYAADLIFGEPIDIDTFLNTTNPKTQKRYRRQDLIEHVVEKIYSLRKQLCRENRRDPLRSLEKYY